MIDRSEFLKLFQAAVSAKRGDFARSLATDWLTCWPADRQALKLLASIELDQKRHGTAIDRLSSVLAADPEDSEAGELVAEALQSAGEPVTAGLHRACAQALLGQIPAIDQAPAWTQALARAVQALGANDLADARNLAQEALLADSSFALPLVIALRAELAMGNQAKAVRLARAGLDRWPDTVIFRLVLAGHELQSGQTDRGLEHLHRCAAADPLAELASGYFGAEHPYLRVWPDKLEAALSRPVPAEVSAFLGGNRLASAGKSAAAEPHARPAAKSEPDGEPLPEPWEGFQGPDPGLAEQQPNSRLSDAWREVRAELDRLADKVNARRPNDDEDERAPAYILLSSRTRLLQETGDAGFARVDEAADGLVATIRKRNGWTAHKVYIDDPTTLRRFGLRPVDPSNPWQVKLRLADLDSALASKGEMIGAVLIVGGHRIVPFHFLPNPTEDDDAEVPSDNPYATRDENYFAPEWPVGRLPGEESDLLARRLRAAADEHRLATSPPRPMSDFRSWLATHFSRYFGLGPKSVGYTASIWKKSSLVVYRSIGEPQGMLTSPPVEAHSLPSSALKPSTFSYYNLHGLEDSAEWYGQRDPLRDAAGHSEFPVALRITDVVNSGRAPRIVFTEACYGANILERTVDDALSLRFLEKGSHAVIGSTKISYGSVTPPLIAADLLGQRFWTHLKAHVPVGEALRRAKLELAAEMHQRQGYLDGEDQKTLISFVLFGDPLYAPRELVLAAGKKSVLRRTSRPSAMKTACSLAGPDGGQQVLDPQAEAQVKSIVARYLPGMAGATCTIHSQHQGCDGEGHLCPSHQLGMKGLAAAPDGPVVVTLSKRVDAGDRHHPSYARLTLDGQGKILKLAVSR
ncbi:MAG TPA: hypothetical protein VGA52_15420 [Anaerolineales bacterium]